jgi:hypothetical protein
MEFVENPLMIEHMSKVVDRCYSGKGDFEQANNPSRQRSRWWKDILGMLELDKQDQWTEVGVTLLNIPYKRHKALEMGFKKIQNNVKNYPRSGDRAERLQLVAGPEQRKTVAVAVAYKDMKIEERNKMMNACATEAMEDHQTDSVIVIAVDTNTRDYPYSYIALNVRSKD